MDHSVLVIAEDRGSASATGAGLQHEGFRSLVLTKDRLAPRRFVDTHPDLVVLDLGLPWRSGPDLCRWIRERSSVPLLVLASTVNEATRVQFLELGADACVAKPCSGRELAAWARALLRRAPTHEVFHAESATRIVHGALVVDVPRHEVRLGERPLPVTPLEFQLLVTLARAPGRIFTRTLLLQRVWDRTLGGKHESRKIDVHMSALRRKLGDEPAGDVWIKTVRGVGYMFLPPDSATAQR